MTAPTFSRRAPRPITFTGSNLHAQHCVYHRFIEAN
jgi:hypothetical protein